MTGHVDLVEKDGTSASTFLATLLDVETECVERMQPGAKGIGVGYYTDATGQSVHLWTLIIGNAP